MTGFGPLMYFHCLPGLMAWCCQERPKEQHKMRGFKSTWTTPSCSSYALCKPWSHLSPPFLIMDQSHYAFWALFSIIKHFVTLFPTSWSPVPSYTRINIQSGITPVSATSTLHPESTQFFAVLCLLAWDVPSLYCFLVDSCTILFPNLPYFNSPDPCYFSSHLPKAYIFLPTPDWQPH